MVLIENLVHDVAHALRQLRRHPGFAAAAIVSLALGIGANTAIFSVLNAVLLRSLPVAAPSQLFKLNIESKVSAAQPFSYPAFVELRDNAAPLKVAAMSRSYRVNVGVDRGGVAERANVQLVSGAFFDLIGLPPAVGRVIEPDDDRQAGGPVAILSDGYWKAHYGGAADVLGRTVSLNGAPFTVVGVAGRGFKGIFLETPTDIWIPTAMQADVRYHQNFSADTSADAEKPWLPQTGILWLDVLVRASDADAARATASLDAAFRQTLIPRADATGDPLQRKLILESRLVLDSFAQGRSRLRERFTPLLYALMGMVAMVLLIACANTANILLARSAARRREIAVRLSLGAGRARVLSQLVTESIVLALLAAAGGVLVAQWSADALVSMVVQSVTGAPASIVEIDGRALAFTALVSVATGLLFGLAPALRATRLSLSEELKIGGRSQQDAGDRTSARLLIGAQVALSLMLVTAAGLFSRSLYNLAHVELGLDRDRVVTVAIDPRNSGVAASALPELYARVVANVEGVPGVAAAAVAECGVEGGCRSASDGFAISGYTPAPSELVKFQENRVSAHYLQAIGVPLVRGRTFDARDRQGSPKVAIVNQALVRRYFDGRDPLGQKFGYQTPDTEIVGVMADARVYSSREPAEPMAYYPIDQQMLFTTSLSVRASGDPRQIVGSVREALRKSDPNLVVERVATLAQQVDNGLGADRVVALLAAAFGALSIVVAGVGLYGLMSYLVARRTSEIGVRIALGAQPGAVLRAILTESLGLVVIGLVVGVPLAAAGGRLIAGVLFGVRPWDLLTLSGAVLTLVVLGVFAAFVPAWRASRVDPVVALRHE